MFFDVLSLFSSFLVNFECLSEIYYVLVVHNYRAEGAFRGSAEIEGEPRFIHVTLFVTPLWPNGKKSTTYDSKTDRIFAMTFGRTFRKI